MLVLIVQMGGRQSICLVLVSSRVSSSHGIMPDISLFNHQVRNMSLRSCMGVLGSDDEDKVNKS